MDFIRFFFVTVIIAILRLLYNVIIEMVKKPNAGIQINDNEKTNAEIQIDEDLKEKYFNYKE